MAALDDTNLVDYAQNVGLDERGLDFLAALPEEVRNVLISRFDPSGTKDGNVFGRLLGFARSVWVQNLGIEEQGGIDQATSIMRSLSDEAQATVMMKFDPSSSFDGNIVARLVGFARSIATRLGTSAATVARPPRNQAPYRPTQPDGPPWRPHPAGSPVGQARTQAQAEAIERAKARVAARSRAQNQTQPQFLAWNWNQGAQSFEGEDQSVQDFIYNMRLDEACGEFVAALQPDVQSVVVSKFDPSGTKDGNVWGRLFGFTRSVWAQRHGLEPDAVAFLKSHSEEVQQVVINKFNSATTKDGNVAARLEAFVQSVAKRVAVDGESIRNQPAIGAVGAPVTRRLVPQVVQKDPIDEFVRRWSMPEDVADFIRQLPETISSTVLSSFTASGTKDGNVWGRFFGFVRSVWGQKTKVDRDTMQELRKLPEETQIRLLLQLGDSSPEEICAAVQETLLGETDDMGEIGEMSVEAVNVGGGIFSEFIARSGLEEVAPEVEELLLCLDPEVQNIVLSEFDPGGTIDGHVFGRLQGFARSLVARKQKRGRSAPIGRPHHRSAPY